MLTLIDDVSTKITHRFIQHTCTQSTSSLQLALVSQSARGALRDTNARRCVAPLLLARYMLVPVEVGQTPQSRVNADWRQMVVAVAGSLLAFGGGLHCGKAPGHDAIAYDLLLAVVITSWIAAGVCHHVFNVSASRATLQLSLMRVYWNYDPLGALDRETVGCCHIEVMTLK